MTPLVFADLDDTLFASRSKQPDGVPLERATTATNGRHSYMSPGQRALFDWLAATTELIPVTARSTEAFNRVHLSFTGPAILAMGAVIRTGTGADPDWRARMAEGAARDGPALAALRARIPAAHDGATFRHWIVEEDGLPVYLCAKSNAEDPCRVGPGLAAVAEALRPLAAAHGIRLSVNGNNLAAVPAGVSKAAAVRHLLATRYAGQDRPVIGMGDSLSDIGFMALGAMAMVPVPSQAFGALVEATCPGAA